MPNPLLYVLFFLSGAAGLVYELVWVRELIFVFGGTTYAITTVLVAFMAGLGLGSFSAGRWCGRLQQPGRVYGLVEISIGIYALIIPLLLGVAEPAYRAVYPYAADNPWLLNIFRFAVSGCILLIPTTLMGATLPILVRHVTLYGRALGLSVGHLYGINTFGAVFGVLAAGFWLIPSLGLKHTTWLAAAANITIGLIAVMILRRRVTAAVAGPTSAGPRCPSRKCDALNEPGATFCARCGVELPKVGAVRASPSAADTPSAAVTMTPTARRVVMVGFAVSGFAAMVYQITWTRALIMSLGSSTYSFTCILAAFILGLALGSLAVARWVDRWKDPIVVFGALELIIGLVAVLIVPIHGQIPVIVMSLVEKYASDYAALLRWQFLLVIAVTFVPTLLMGAIFPLVTRTLATEGIEAGAATGRAYAINTLGTIAGSFLAGFVLIRSDFLGVQNSIVLASVLNGVVGLALVLVGRPALNEPAGRRAVVPTVGLVAIPLLALLSGQWDPKLVNSAPFFGRGITMEALKGREFDYLAEGVDMTVSVYHYKPDPDRLTLTVNGKPDASTGTEDMTSQLMIGHLPALFAPPGKDVCVIGLGSGMTLAAVARQPSFERLDCAEISDEVIHAAGCFMPFTYNILTDDPRVHLIRADGRNHLLLTDRRYELIISEPSNPWIAGVANLFTREFFELCKGRLTDHGVLAMWLQGYSTSVNDFRMVVRTLFDVFDNVSLWGLHENDYMLLAVRHPGPMNLTRFLERYDIPAVRQDLYRVGMHRPAHLLGRYIMSGPALRQWAQSAPIHTDDNALLEFSAPRHLYAGDKLGLPETFHRLQRPVLADLFQVDAQTDLPPGLQADIEAVVAARWARIRADEALDQHDIPGALRILLDGFRGDPSNGSLFVYLNAVRRQIQTGSPEFAASPEMAPLLAEVEQLHPPVLLPRRGGSRAAVATLLRKLSEQASELGRWDFAVDHLSQAHKLDPSRIDMSLALGYALVRAGRLAETQSILDEIPPQRQDDGHVRYLHGILAVQNKDMDAALPLLEAAIKAGVPGKQMVEDEALRPIWADSRFRSLTQVSETTQPTSAPP